MIISIDLSSTAKLLLTVSMKDYLNMKHDNLNSVVVIMKFCLEMDLLFTLQISFEIATNNVVLEVVGNQC